MKKDKKNTRVYITCFSALLVILFSAGAFGNTKAMPWLLLLLDNKTWIHPNGLSDNISPDGRYAVTVPNVAMGNNGNAIITWVQGDGSNYKVFKSEYRNGAWTHPSGLSDNISPDGQDAEYPNVAMDNNGNAIITWYQSDGSNYQIFKSEYRNGAWVHPSGLSDNISPDGQNARYPNVAMDNNGNAIITWQQVLIFKSEYRNGAWTHPSGISDNISPAGQDATNMNVAMDDNGNAIITWAQDLRIYKSEYRNGAWTHPSGISDYIDPAGPNARLPNVVMDNNGNAIITWEQGDGSNKQIFKSEYRNGTWVHPNGLSDNISPNGQDAVIPKVAMDNNRKAIITWYQSDGSNKQIFKSEYRNGAWTHPSGLSDNISPDGQDVWGSNVAMDDNGNGIITWNQIDGSNKQIFKSEYR